MPCNALEAHLYCGIGEVGGVIKRIQHGQAPRNVVRQLLGEEVISDGIAPPEQQVEA